MFDRWRLALSASASAKSVIVDAPVGASAHVLSAAPTTRAAQDEPVQRGCPRRGMSRRRHHTPHCRKGPPTSVCSVVAVAGNARGQSLRGLLDALAELSPWVWPPTVILCGALGGATGRTLGNTTLGALIGAGFVAVCVLVLVSAHPSVGHRASAASKSAECSTPDLRGTAREHEEREGDQSRGADANAM